MNHELYMRRCIELAERSRGRVFDGALVGAVLVRGDSIIAEGYFQGPGNPHAEVDMIKNCEQEIQPEDRLYVNLEPCCHTGKTPPCTAAIIEAGIKTVVCGMQDPDARVSGRGIAALRSAGIKVITPVCRAECERLNRGFVSLRTRGRPYITLKSARSRSGAIANADGTPLKITSQQQDAWSHEHLRAKHNAIAVGVQTIIADDPQLTVRLNKKSDQEIPQPLKIIFDPHLRTPLDARCLDERVIIVTDQATRPSDHPTIASLKEKGVTVIPVSLINDHFDLSELWSQLTTNNQQLSTLLVEGGQKTWDAFKTAGLVDEEVCLIGDC